MTADLSIENLTRWFVTIVFVGTGFFVWRADAIG